MMNIPMSKMTMLSGIVAFLAPLIILLLPKKINNKVQPVLPLLYCIVIVFFTITEKHVLEEREVNLTPFWSYSSFNHPEIRWQVYMNVFLFIPFGFLIPFSTKKRLFQTLIISCCLSVTIEALQYIFALGFCEIDDVFHNTLGGVIGYLYWLGLSKVNGWRRTHIDNTV